jgi:hypothetical protein
MVKQTSQRLPLCEKRGKVQFPTDFEAYKAMVNAAQASREPVYLWGTYQCWFCHSFHFGHKAQKSNYEGHVENRRRVNE